MTHMSYLSAPPAPAPLELPFPSASPTPDENILLQPRIERRLHAAVEALHLALLVASLHVAAGVRRNAIVIVIVRTSLLLLFRFRNERVLTSHVPRAHKDPQSIPLARLSTKPVVVRVVVGAAAITGLRLRRGRGRSATGPAYGV